MANEKNLIPFTSEQSREEAKKNGRKGGYASGEARRRKADLRKMAQTLLDGTFTDKNGNEFTGEELVLKGLMTNLGTPNGRNWGKAMEIMITLLGASMTPEQRENLKASTEKIKAETRRITGDSEHHNGMLEDLIKGLRQDDIHSEAETPDAEVADESTETNQSS